MCSLICFYRKQFLLTCTVSNKTQHGVLSQENTSWWRNVARAIIYDMQYVILLVKRIQDIILHLKTVRIYIQCCGLSIEQVSSCCHSNYNRSKQVIALTLTFSIKQIYFKAKYLVGNFWCIKVCRNLRI